jgi:hypothetical protein
LVSSYVGGASAITAAKDDQHRIPQCAYDSFLDNRFHQSMDCGGSWKGFRGVNGGECEGESRKRGLRAGGRVWRHGSMADYGGPPKLQPNNVMSPAKYNSKELTESTDTRTNGSQNGNRLRSKYGAVEATGGASERGMTPILSHKLKHNKSILALAVSADALFAGTEGGEILVNIVPAQQGSIAKWFRSTASKRISGP